MGGWLRQRLPLLLDLVTDRYQGVLVTTEAERSACQALLDRIRGGELARDRYVLDAPLMRDGAVADDGLMAVRDRRTGQLVGAVRATRMSLVAAQPHLAPDFQIDPAVLAGRLHTTFLCHRMVVDPAHRKTAASLVLMRTVYALGVQHDGLMCVLDCEPPLARVYRRLGFQAVGRPYTRDGVLFITMLLANRDQAHLARVRSPLRSTWQAMGRPEDPGIAEWRARVEATGHLPTQHFDHVEPTEPVALPLLQGLSRAGRAAALFNATRLRVAPGQVILQAGTVGRWAGMIEAGTARAVGPAGRHHLTAGDPVGASALVGQTVRPDDVVAGPQGATLLMLSPSAAGRVRRPRDRQRLWANVARSLARRATAPARPTRGASAGVSALGGRVPGAPARLRGHAQPEAAANAGHRAKARL